jgi:hypothetical protein
VLVNSVLVKQLVICTRICGSCHKITCVSNCDVIGTVVGTKMQPNCRLKEQTSFHTIK